MLLDWGHIKYSAKLHYWEIITKYPPSLRILLVHFLEMYLTLYHKHPWCGTIQKLGKSTSQSDGKHFHLQTQNRALTLDKVWSLGPPHCEGPPPRRAVVLPRGGGDYLFSLLFHYRDEETGASPTPTSLSSLSPPWLFISLFCESFKHFLMTHALKFNSFVSLKHTACKCMCCYLITLDIFKMC